MSAKVRPWGDYAFRVLACALLFGSAFGLLSESTFAYRLRDDAPAAGGLTGSQTLALAIAATLAILPLLAGKRFLGVFLASSFVAAGMGSYWWTKVSWDELVTETDFTVSEGATVWDYTLVALPALVAVFYVAASRASRLRAEYRARGLDEEQVRRAAWSSWIAGVGLFLGVTAMSLAFWSVLASGVLFATMSQFPTGVPALVAAAALLTVAIALGAGRLPKPDPPSFLTRPWRAAAGLAARARSRGRKSPS